MLIALSLENLSDWEDSVCGRVLMIRLGPSSTVTCVEVKELIDQRIWNNRKNERCWSYMRDDHQSWKEAVQEWFKTKPRRF